MHNHTKLLTWFLPACLVFKTFYAILFIYVKSATKFVLESQENIVKSNLSFQYVCPGDQIQVIKLGSRHISVVSHLSTSSLHLYLQLFFGLIFASGELWSIIKQHLYDWYKRKYNCIKQTP